jgi:nitrate reductase gamma subunit
MNTFLAIFTYFAYVFIIAMYTKKAITWLDMPAHMRWDLYPVIHEENYRYGGSYFEHMDWWTRVRSRAHVRGLLYLLKEYFTLGEYFKKNMGYWYFLYPWHVGFILIITFHILCFFGALLMTLGITVSPGSPDVSGTIFYYAIFLTGVISFITGAFGSIGVLVKRIVDKNLSLYASPLNYFTYLFTLAVFLSGLYAWYFVDPAFSEYRDFWKGLLTLNFVRVEPGAVVHIVLFNFFLVYLPFTRSMHYVTRFFAFFLIRWDDEPNLKGSKLEKKLQKLVGQKITWSAAHIKSGETWFDNVKPEG